MPDDPTRQTAQVADELMEVLLDGNPLGGSLFGIAGRDDQLGDYTEAGDEAALDQLRGIAARAAAIDPATLSATGRVTRAVVRQVAECAWHRLIARGVEYTVSDSVFTSAIDMLRMVPLVTIAGPADIDAYLARLRRVPQALEAIGQRHRTGIAAGRLPVRRLAEGAVASLDRMLAAGDDDPLRRPGPPGGDPAFDRERDRLLTGTVGPAVRRYRDLLHSEVLPHGRPDERAGLCHLPDGESYYSGLVWIHAGAAGQTPEELHQTGRQALAELTEEVTRLGSTLFGTSDLAAIADLIRDEPASRWRDGEEAVTAARAALRRAEHAAPSWFDTLPAHRCTVDAMPDGGAPDAPRGFYLPPTLSGSRHGRYAVNANRARQQCRFSGEALVFFGAVPGQHLLFGTAVPRTDLPLIRRVGPFGTAFQAGWGLYAAELADEMHLYSDNLARLGMLSEVATRAARVVVDTGLHLHGWSRQQAVDYLRAGTLMAETDIQAETDQYIAAPGQALASMVGRSEIRRLRTVTERALGERYDISQFHEVVLGSGSLPLGVLDDLVSAWLAEQRPTVRLP